MDLGWSIIPRPFRSGTTQHNLAQQVVLHEQGHDSMLPADVFRVLNEALGLYRMGKNRSCNLRRKHKTGA